MDFDSFGAPPPPPPPQAGAADDFDFGTWSNHSATPHAIPSLPRRSTPWPGTGKLPGWREGRGTPARGESGAP